MARQSLRELTGIKRVLVVDDEVTVLSLVLRWMSDAGFEVVACQSVDAARACIESPWKPELLVTDVRVGGANGLHLSVRAQQLLGTPSIVMTGYNDPVLEKEAQSLKAPFLVKPVTRDQLAEAIQSVFPAKV